MVALWIDAHALDNADQDDHDTAGVRALLEALQAVTPPDWHADALCREYDASLWFPARGESTSPARAICARCLVRDECASYVLDELGPETHGIWAGLSRQDRSALRRDAA